MSYRVGVAKLKQQFSDFLNQVSQRRLRIHVQRRGRTVAVMIPPDEEADLEDPVGQHRKGLLAAVGAWSDYPDLEGFLQVVQKARAHSHDRPVEELP